jgi:hypothetical protein
MPFMLQQACPELVEGISTNGVLSRAGTFPFALSLSKGGCYRVTHGDENNKPLATNLNPTCKTAERFRPAPAAGIFQGVLQQW